MKPLEHITPESEKEAARRRHLNFGALSDGYDNNFDFLRFLLAALVIYCHSHPLLSGNGNRDILGQLTRGRFDFGDVAVNGFFVISGFLITGSWLRSRGTWDFLKKRILRIYPGFIVASLFCVLLVGPLAAAHLPTYLANLDPLGTIKRLLLLREPNQAGAFSGLHSSYLNGSLWTIKYEFWCYLLVIALGLSGALRRRALPLLLFLASLLVYGLVGYDPTHRPAGEGIFLEKVIGSLYHWPRFLACFLAGAVFFLYREKIPYSPKWLAVSLAALAACVWQGMAVFLPVFGTYALLYAAFHPGLKLQEFGRRGDFSYGLYLYAWPVQQLLLFYFGGVGWNPHTLFVAAFVVTLGLAMVSWHLVEKPFLKRKGGTSAVRVVPDVLVQPVEAKA